MRRKYLFAVLLCHLCATLSAPSQSPEWKGRIESEDGIRVVKNPGEPLYGEITLDLEEDLSIGNDTDQNYLFYKVRDVEVDGAGNIYILDFGNFRVQKFDAQGRYIRTFGKQGEGPGEFNAPTKLKIDDRTGELFVSDNLRVIKRFNEEGEYLDKDIQVYPLLSDFFIGKEERIWGKFSDPLANYLRIVNFEGAVETELAEIPYKLHKKIQSKTRVSRLRMNVQGYVFSHGYEYDLFLSRINGRTFVYGNSREYKLKIVDSDAKVQCRVFKDESPQGFTSSERDRIKFRIQSGASAQGRYLGDFALELPEHKPFFYALHTDDLGRIYAQKTPSTQEYHEVYEYDVFSSQGIYLYRANIGRRPDVIKGGFLYTRTTDDESGEELVKRYRIVNWDRMNKGIN